MLKIDETSQCAISIVQAMFLRAQVRKCPENWWMNFLIILVQKPVWLLPRADCHTHKKVSRPSDISDTKVHHLLGFFRRWSRHGFSKPSATATQLAEKLKNWPEIKISVGISVLWKINVWLAKQLQIWSKNGYLSVAIFLGARRTCTVPQTTFEAITFDPIKI